MSDRPSRSLGVNMLHWTRRQHIAGLGAMAASVGFASPAHAADIKDYLGVWSGTLSTGNANNPTVRYKLVVTSEISASLYLVDQVPDEWMASRVELKPDSVTLEFADLEDEKLTGSLIDPDTLRLTTTWPGAPPVDFKRGDAYAPPILSREVLAKAREAAGAPAMAAAWSRNRNAPRILVDGVRSLDATTPVKTTDKWVFNSITKSMTATLVARLIEARRTTWDATVGDVLGPTLSDMRDDFTRASFRHLLSHRAGLTPDVDAPARASFSRGYLADPRPERLRYAGLALRQPPTAGLGEKMIYANNGYVVAAAMIETICGQSWEDLIVAHVFKPLALKSAGIGQPASVGKLDQPVGHYADANGKMIPYVPGRDETTLNVAALAPTGDAHMNLADLLTYLNAHLFQPSSFLGAASWRTLHTPPFGGNYAMGWFIRGDGRLYHAGMSGRWYSEAIIAPATKTVAAVSANAMTRPLTLAVDRLLEGALLKARQ